MDNDAKFEGISKAFLEELTTMLLVGNEDGVKAREVAVVMLLENGEVYNHHIYKEYIDALLMMGAVQEFSRSVRDAYVHGAQLAFQEAGLEFPTDRKHIMRGFRFWTGLQAAIKEKAGAAANEGEK